MSDMREEARICAEEAGMGALADRFFKAIEDGDIDSVRNSYHPDAEIWLNIHQRAATREENVEVLTRMVKRTVSRSYDDRRVEVFPGGFVQQHVLNAVRKDGYKLVLPAVLVCKVKNGLIVRLDEYFDSVLLKGWYDLD